MHIFVSIVAAGITLYLLRNWWETRRHRRVMRRMNELLYPDLHRKPQRAPGPSRQRMDAKLRARIVSISVMGFALGTIAAILSH